MRCEGSFGGAVLSLTPSFGLMHAGIGFGWRFCVLAFMGYGCLTAFGYLGFGLGGFVSLRVDRDLEQRSSLEIKHMDPVFSFTVHATMVL